MAKLIQYDEDARAAMKRGMDALAEAVKTTLGPKGRNVALDKKYGAPTVTHDGVTVAREVELEDPFDIVEFHQSPAEDVHSVSVLPSRRRRPVYRHMRQNLAP